MLFNSWTFILFLILVLSLYHTTSWRIQNLLLLLASYIFYAFWDWRFIALLATSTIVDYLVALQLQARTDPRARKALLMLSLGANLGMLGFFKYFNFFIDSAITALDSLGVEANPPLLQVVLPVGISFYTFQTLAYTIDVYRGHLKPTRDFATYALYVCYFPQLVAGPIERAARLLPQLQSRRHITQKDWNEGAQLILWGFLKKVAIADSLARFVNDAFADPAAHSPAFLWLSMYCFAIQIYCDFSGYTDIARGTSRLFGINLMENFRQPYLSASITEFWRRWHISLSSWLRDYLYIPLGGNRHGEGKRYRNLMLTMLLGGLWHGAAWTFVLWGGLHGLLLALHRFATRGGSHSPAQKPKSIAAKFSLGLKIFITFHLVSLAWIPFRAQNWSTMTAFLKGLTHWSSMGTFADLVSTGIVDNLLFYALLIIVLDIMCWIRGRELPFSDTHHWAIRGTAYGIGLITLAFIRGGDGEPFIYFQF